MKIYSSADVAYKQKGQDRGDVPVSLPSFRKEHWHFDLCGLVSRNWTAEEHAPLQHCLRRIALEVYVCIILGCCDLQTGFVAYLIITTQLKF